MLLWIAAAFLSFYIKGICGFANTLVFTAMLSFTNSNALISPVSLMLGYPTNAIIAFKERKYIDWKVCILLSALVIAGSIPGTFFLKNADAGIIKQLFGVGAHAFFYRFGAVGQIHQQNNRLLVHLLYHRKACQYQH